MEPKGSVLYSQEPKIGPYPKPAESLQLPVQFSCDPFKKTNFVIRLSHSNQLLPVVTCGCETWSLKRSEGNRLRVFEKRVLKRILGPKRKDIIGWRN